MRNFLALRQKAKALRLLSRVSLVIAMLTIVWLANVTPFGFAWSRELGLVMVRIAVGATALSVFLLICALRPEPRPPKPRRFKTGGQPWE